MSLGLVLLLVLVLVGLGLALASGSSTQLWFALRGDRVSQANLGARSVIGATLEELFESPDLSYGLGGESAELEFPDLEWARLTFDPVQAEEWGIPYSTNNIASTRTTLGWGQRPVPAGAIHLIAVASGGGAQRSVEAYLRVEQFPYAIASSGPIGSAGSLTVATLDPEQPEQMRPADIVSNSTAGDALVLAPGSLVTGDAQAAGGIQVEGTEIWGEVRHHADPVGLQPIDITALDPLAQGPFEALSSGVCSDPLTQLEGTVRRAGDLEVEGDLRLDAALLFVTGDLTIQGDLSGSGIVVVAGDLVVEGQATLAGANRMALVCGGRADLVGEDAATSSFRGLIYTKEGFAASRVTVQGALLVDGGPQASVLLQDTRFLHEPLVVESTGPRELINYSLPDFNGDDLLSVVNFDNRRLEFYRDSDIHGVVDDRNLFLADPSSYPGVTPAVSVAIDDVFFDVPLMTAAHVAACESLIADLELALPSVANPGDINAALPGMDGPFIQAFLLLFSDDRFGLYNEGISFAPGQVLELGEFLRPQERTRLLFWREGGTFASP